MKIGLVCPYNMYKGGGVQECVRAMCEELTVRGHDVRIITPQPRKTSDANIDNCIFIGTAAQIRSPFHTSAQVSVSVNVDMLEDVLVREKFDVLHFHEPWVPILSRQILARSTCANIATFHAKLPDTVMSKTIERVITPYTRSILKDLDVLTAVSDAAAEYVNSLTEQPVKIIPNGIDLSKYKTTRNHKTAKKILYIGRLEKRKGVKYLIQAFNLMNDPDSYLVIAGDGPDRTKLEQLCEQLDVNNVSFEGYISDERKLELLSEATLFCSPALYGESFGIVILEAMAMGLPVVAGSNPGYSSVLKDRGALGLVNPKDAEAFTRVLRLLLNDDALRAQWIEWASEYVKRFNYERVVTEYETLYKDVLKRL